MVWLEMDPVAVCWHKKGGRFLASVFGPLVENSVATGPQKRPLFFGIWQWRITFQAQAMWKWSNYLHSQVPLTKKPLCINVDETSVKLDQDVQHGHVTDVARKLAKGKTLRRKIPKGITRTAYSLVAVICDDSDIQKLLPQFIVVNKRTCTEAVHKTLLETMPPNMKLWRRESAWLDTRSICQVVREVSKALRPYQSTHQVILSMDACKTHMSRLVWQTAARLGFMMFGIPALTTGFLQPLDVYVFAQLKNILRRVGQSSCIDIGVSYCTLGMSIVTLVDAISEVFHGHCWRASFEHLGLSGHQRSLSQQLLNSLDLKEMPVVSNGFPTLADLTNCFPRGSVIDIDAVFKGVLSVTTVKPLICAAPLLKSVARLSVVHDSCAVASAGSSAIPSRLVSSSAPAPPPWRRRASSLRELSTGTKVYPLPAAPPPLPPPAGPLPRDPVPTPRLSGRRTSSGASVR